MSVPYDSSLILTYRGSGGTSTRVRPPTRLTIKLTLSHCIRQSFTTLHLHCLTQALAMPSKRCKNLSSKQVLSSDQRDWMKFGFQIRADHISRQSPFHPSKNVAVKGTTAYAAVDKKIGQVSQSPDTLHITGDSDDEDQDAMDMDLDEFCDRYYDVLEDQDASGASDIEILKLLVAVKNK